MVVVAGDDDEAVGYHVVTHFLRLVSADENVHIQKLGKFVELRFGLMSPPHELVGTSAVAQISSGWFSLEDFGIEGVHHARTWERVGDHHAVGGSDG